MPSLPKDKPKVFVSQDGLAIYRKLLVTAVRKSSSPSAKLLEGRLRAGDFSFLLEWSERVSPQMYETAACYFADAQIASLIKKYPFTKSQIRDIDPRGTAISAFYKSEHKCKRTNQRFRAMRSPRRKPRPLLSRPLDMMAQFIERTLGEFKLEEILDECGTTGGASIGVTGEATNFARKILLNGEMTCTAPALPYAIQAMWRNFHMRDCILPGAVKCHDYAAFSSYVKDRAWLLDYNKISFVTKTARTDRSIAVEPMLNGYLQKGTDVYMRRRLSRIGIDLSDQDTNSYLARLGSLGGFNPYVTIDLRAASDSLSYEVVRRLLPREWFQWLCAIRSSRFVQGQKDPQGFEKFCTMGNGFCFPLETLIFASVCYVVAQLCGDPMHDFSVYGDDIIVRQNQALLVIELLKLLGFSTNVAKTFITGPFRESCGSDWYEGTDVRPVVWDKPVIDVRQAYALHNGTYRSETTEHFFSEFRESLRDLVPGVVRPGVEVSDTCYSVPLDVAVRSPYVLWDRDLMQWSWVELRSIPVEDPVSIVFNRSAAVMYSALSGGDPETPYALRYTTRPRWCRVGYPVPMKVKPTRALWEISTEHVRVVRERVWIEKNITPNFDKRPRLVS